ncbi:phosphatidate cytidylyltransferase [Bartonella sp. A05]|uniref:phosphatidate cytidylyltransferase n=1 Tax=Bartonella sp. A05 TaxID=2967261 RepID=UPI0022A9C2D9|nr:phosphatidate cytidylyltransferase [Bartonella sp. A05]MCZ2204172.1 phosphatidate cytidylyltransferase [Bartonella sp. A05]
MSNLISRTLTAFVFGAITLYLTWVGGILFFLFAWGIGGFILYEWVSITKEKWRFLQKILAGIFYLIFGLFLVSGISALLIFGLLIVFAVLLGMLSVRNIGWVSFGFLYASFPVVALSFLRGYEILGFWVVIFLFTIVWGTDVAAYFSGRALGGRKLAPRFSPNKTWSGAFGGTVAGILGGILVALLVFDISSTLFFVLLLAFILSVISQIGDLGQSCLKRRFSVKDSGYLLPGHGGFMDRMDGLVAAAFLLYLIGAIISGVNTPFNFFTML